MGRKSVFVVLIFLHARTVLLGGRKVTHNSEVSLERRVSKLFMKEYCVCVGVRWWLVSGLRV